MKKSHIQLLVVFLHAIMLVSCNNDDNTSFDDRIEEDPCADFINKNDETCGVRLYNLDSIPRTGAIRMYGATNTLDNPGWIWGIAESIVIEKCFSFIAEEELINYGVRILSTSDIEETYTVEFLEDSKEVYVAVKHLSGDDVICISGVRQSVKK